MTKAKEEATSLKQKSQAQLKISKEEEKARAKATSHVTSLEKDKERLSEELKAKCKEAKKWKDRAAELESDNQDLKTSLERVNGRLQGYIKKSRMAQEQQDHDDDGDSDDATTKSRQPVRKRLKLGAQSPAQTSGEPSLDAIIQQHVAEALKRVMPQGLISQPQTESNPPPPPPVRQPYYSARDPWYGHGSETGSHYQAPSSAPWMKSSHGPQHAPHHQAATPPPITSSSGSFWPTSQLNLSHDSPMESTPSMPAFSFGSSSTPRSPGAEAKPDVASSTPQEMIQAFLEYMKSKK